MQIIPLFWKLSFFSISHKKTVCTFVQRRLTLYKRFFLPIEPLWSIVSILKEGTFYTLL